MRNLSLLLLLFLFSCTPQKRFANFLRRHPEFVKSDTIYKYDTIHIAGTHKDSTFHFYQHDTVFLKKDNLSIKYYLNHDSTVFLQGKCDPIVKVIRIPIQVNSVALKPSLTFGQKAKIFVFDNGWWIALVVVIILFILRKLKVI